VIISRTPFRISFLGGGTDFRDFYMEETGFVVSTTIDKYMFITVNKRHDDTIRLAYMKMEIADSLEEIRHPLIREAMRLTGISKGVEITSMADIPSRGTGLGSSSAFTVGLLNALNAYKGQHCSAEKLAADACRIEIDIVGEPIGKQDQYIAAYGGLQQIQFNPDETTFMDPIVCSPETKERLQQHLVLFFTGITREAGSILGDQKKRIPKNKEVLVKLRDLARDMAVALKKNKVDDFGALMHEGWLCKQKLADGISNDTLDSYYEKARKAGALGGKILGAGGGGFILLYCPRDDRTKVIEALSDLKLTPFSFEPQGSKIIYIGG
jgi:D-glycero-alpha-D-manno-heptose-7-phosphate kinase